MNESGRQACIADHLRQHIDLARLVLERLTPAIEHAADLLINALTSGHKIMLCGNGGSAADAQHIAAELAGRYQIADRRALPAIALTTDSSVMTSVGNDFGFDRIFARQVEGLGQPGDVLIGISTSGGSRNVIAAVEQARRQGLETIGLLGRSGGELLALVDSAIVVPSDSTAHIQEMHITIGHLLCALIENATVSDRSASKT
ncbi:MULTISPECIES: D-sedoheptulose 7-phosphate isomerase [unclassified Thiocapsa]|uniref:D-sedoheptulose 7-phosphate isomerase n=1 Tax=unclassified Thiocapsa TaxID=2641286 RepID=UPI0035AF7712